MNSPSPKLRLTVAALYVGIPLGHAAQQVIVDGKVTQKLPPAIGAQVVLTSASTDTGTVYIGQEALRPFADMTLGRWIRREQPQKQGQEQLPTKGFLDTGGTTGDDPTDTG